MGIVAGAKIELSCHWHQVFELTQLTHLLLFSILQDFWTALPNKKNYGRLYARYRLAKILTAVAHRDPYDQNDISTLEEGERKAFLSPPLPLVRWSSKHWTDLAGLLENTRELMLRKDVDMVQEKDDEENEERAQSDLYNQKVDRLLTYIRLNQALADFRATVEEQLEVKDGTVKVDPSILAKFG